MDGDGGGSGAKWGEGVERWERDEWLLRVALYGLGAAVLGHLALARGGQRERGKEKREAPFSGEDTDPLWLRAIAWLVGCLLGLGELSVVKILWVLVTSCFYYASKAPFYVQSLLAQRGSRVRRDVEYGPRPRNRLDVYRPEPALAAACGSGEYGRAVIMMVHGGAWFWGDKLYFAKVQGASFPDCTVVPINYTLHPHADCEQVPPLFQLNNLPQGHILKTIAKVDIHCAARCRLRACVRCKLKSSGLGDESAQRHRPDERANASCVWVLEIDGKGRIVGDWLDLPKPLPRGSPAAGGHGALCRRAFGDALRLLQVNMEFITPHVTVCLLTRYIIDDWLWQEQMFGKQGAELVAAGAPLAGSVAVGARACVGLCGLQWRLSHFRTLPPRTVERRPPHQSNVRHPEESYHHSGDGTAGYGAGPSSLGYVLAALCGRGSLC